MTALLRPPADEDVLPADLLAEAAQLASGWEAVCGAYDVNPTDVAAAVGPLDMLALRAIAVAWRRAGKLSYRPVPAGGAVTSVRVTAAKMDPTGSRMVPSNVDQVLGQLRSDHPDSSVIAGLLVWRRRDGSVELAIPGEDHVVRALGDGEWHAVPSGR